MPTLIDELRAATAPHHERTEAAFDLTRACASRDAYADLLSRFLSVFRPLEAKLGSIDWQPLGLDWRERQRAASIERDLHALGRDPAQVRDCAVGAIPASTPLEAFGVLYVLEGSTLGGQFIRKQVAASLGLDATNGCAFFAGHGDRTGVMWRAFLDAANAAGAALPDAKPAACEAAVATFELFGRTLSAETPIAQ